MYRYLISLLLYSLALIAQDQVLNFDAFVKKETDLANDIAYMQMLPEYEVGMNPKDGVVLEFYSGVYDGSEQSKTRLEFIKKIIADEKRLNPKLKVESIGYAKHKEIFSEDKKYNEMKNIMSLNRKTFEEVLPKSFMSLPNKSRKPSGVRFPTRWAWTLLRGSSAAAGTYISLVYVGGVSEELAAVVSIFPAILSGGITYHMGAYGDFLTNGKWSNWLYSSDKWFAKKLRPLFGLGKNNLERRRRIFSDFYKHRYPDLYKNNQEIFKKLVREKVKTSIISRFHTGEEYLKWYVTEVIFVGGALRGPQAAFGVTELAAPLEETADLLKSSAVGMGAQGPGDLAIQKRKYQRVDELEKNVLSGKKKVEDVEKLLDDIKKFKDPKIKYSIGPHSHKALRGVENWARSRATLLSFLSVAGVSLEVAGVPAATPILIGTGAGGAVYYAKVRGLNWQQVKSASRSSIQKFTKFLKNPIGVTFRTIAKRWCLAPFKMPMPN